MYSKGILKGKNEIANPAHVQTTNQNSGVKWDEKAIEEDMKSRGNKMKITEPKTPYNPDNEVKIKRIWKLNLMKKQNIIQR